MYALVYLAKKRGGRLAIARNSHKSVYNACAVLGVEPYLLKTNERDGVLLPPAAADVEEAFKRENVGAVLVTSPDYFGNVADLAALSRVCRRHGKLLLADGAHGAALRFDADEKDSYAGNFADAWVDGAHKTLPTLTQGAILNLRDEALEEDAEDALNLFRTTSPSYLVMASVEYGVKFMQEKGAALTDALRRQLNFIRAKLKKRGIAFYEHSHTLTLAIDFSAAASPRRRLWKSFPAERCSPSWKTAGTCSFISRRSPRLRRWAGCTAPLRPSGGCVRCARGKVQDTSYVSGVKRFAYLTALSLAHEYVPLEECVGPYRGALCGRHAALLSPSWSRANRSPRKRRRRSAPLPIPSGSGKGRSPSSKWAAKRNLS